MEADHLYGEAGNDKFIATSSTDGSDVIDGGSDLNGRGSDTIDYSAIADSDTNLTTGGIVVTLNDSTVATVTVDGGNNDSI